MPKSAKTTPPPAAHTPSATESSQRPIMELLDLIGQRWTLRILWELRGEALSFRQLQQRCDQLSPSILNKRLHELRAATLVELSDKGYTLTPLGLELGGKLMDLTHWAERWRAQRAPNPHDAPAKPL